LDRVHRALHPSYTTLFRSATLTRRSHAPDTGALLFQGDAFQRGVRDRISVWRAGKALRLGVPFLAGRSATRDGEALRADVECFRSEEHTSELQSRENLVCR